MAASEGIWSYRAGTSGTVVVAAGGRVLQLSAIATGAGSITINGGDSIPIPAGAAVTLVPEGNIGGSPTIVFTGTAAFFVEVVT